MSILEIKKIRSELNLSQEELAKMIGVSIRTIQNWEAGKVIPKSKYAILHDLKSRNSNIVNEKVEKVHGKLIPFYDDITLTGGNGAVSNTDVISQTSEYIDTGDWFKDATAAIRYCGESMVGYPTGCILVLKEVLDHRLIIPGQDYVIETSEYRVTKQVQLNEGMNFITAYSTNKETYEDGRLIHAPFNIPWDAVVRVSLVLGYVVKKNGSTIAFNSKEKEQ